MPKLVSTKLLMAPGLLRPPLPSPTELNGPLPTAPTPLKVTLSEDWGAPGNCQFRRSDQLVVAVTLLLPTQSTDGRVPVGPEVSVSNTAVLSPLGPTVPTEPAGRVTLMLNVPLSEAPD